MTETNNFNKICNIAMDNNFDILEELTDGQIERIKFDPKHVYVVYATAEHGASRTPTTAKPGTKE